MSSSPSSPEKSFLRETIEWAATLLLLLLGFLLVVPVVVPLLLGQAPPRPTTVLTRSMEKTLFPGDVVMVQAASLQDIAIGDVIKVQAHSGDAPAAQYSHRVVGITMGSQGKILTTQGDNNNVVDEVRVTRQEQVRGRLLTIPGTRNLYVVPRVGYLLQRKALLYPLGGGLLAAGLVMMAVSLLRRKPSSEGDGPQDGGHLHLRRGDALQQEVGDLPHEAEGLVAHRKDRQESVDPLV